MTAIQSSSYTLPSLEGIPIKLPIANQSFRYDPSITVSNEIVSIKMSEETQSYTYKKEDPKRLVFRATDWPGSKKNKKEKPQEKIPEITTNILGSLEFVNQLKIRENMSYSGLIISGTSEALGPGLLTFANGTSTPVFFWSSKYRSLWPCVEEKALDTCVKIYDLHIEMINHNLQPQLT